MKIQLPGSILALLSTMFSCPPIANADDGAGNVRTVPVPDHGRPVVAKIDPEGIIHLLYDSDDGPKYTKSTDGGASFDSSIPVVDRGSQKAGLEYSGWDMAVGKNGRIHVAMSTNAWKLKLPEDEWGFFYANLDPQASTFSPVRNINRKPSEGFSLATDDKGNVTACWLSGKLFANVSHDNGETFGPYVELNTRYNPCDCCTTSAAYGADGRLAVLYREKTDNERDMYVVIWDQHGGNMSRTRVSRTLWKIDGCPMTYFAISRERDGFAAIWPTKGEVYFARLDGNANPSSPAEIKTPGRSGMRTGMLALSGRGGHTLLAWNHGGQIGWQLYGAHGESLGEPGFEKTSGQGVAGVVGKDGRFILFR